MRVVFKAQGLKREELHQRPDPLYRLIVETTSIEDLLAKVYRWMDTHYGHCGWHINSSGQIVANDSDAGDLVSVQVSHSIVFETKREELEVLLTEARQKEQEGASLRQAYEQQLARLGSNE